MEMMSSVLSVSCPLCSFFVEPSGIIIVYQPISWVYSGERGYSAWEVNAAEGIVYFTCGRWRCTMDIYTYNSDVKTVVFALYCVVARAVLF